MGDHTTAVEMKKSGSGSMLFGVALVLFGILALASPIIPTIAIAYTLGFMLVAAGALQAWMTFQEKDWAGVVLSLLYIAGGVLVLMKPLGFVTVLTLFVGIWFFAMGAMRLFAAFQISENKGWLIFGAILNIVLGILILMRWPASSLWAIGILVGVDVLFTGVMMITVGGTVRSIGADAQARLEADVEGS